MKVYKLFLDTNILLDVIEARPNFFIPSTNILDLGVRKKVDLYATSLTFANCFYVARKSVGAAQAILWLQRVKKYVHVCAMDEAQCETALFADAPDFEDMLQYQSALAANCDVIITRNKKHFPNDTISVMTPAEFFDIYTE